VFVGHYAVSLAAKRAQPQRSLGGLFIATQLLDVVWGTFVLVGIEQVTLVPNGVGSAGVEQDFVPFSHGLVGALAWAALAYLAIRLAPIGSRTVRSAAAALIAAVVASHYLLDFIVHAPELPLLDHSLEIGLGLSGMAAFTIESALLLGGLWLYLGATVARNALGRYGMIGFAILLIAFNLYVVTSPTPASLAIVALSNLGAYAVLAGIAEWLDRQRAPAPIGTARERPA
jgi:hypothetical protein